MRDYNSRLAALRDQRQTIEAYDKRRFAHMATSVRLPLERTRPDRSGVPVALVVVALVVGVWIGAVVTAGAL